MPLKYDSGSLNLRYDKVYQSLGYKAASYNCMIHSNT